MLKMVHIKKSQKKEKKNNISCRYINKKHNMHVYQTKIFLLNTHKYLKNVKACYQLCKGSRSQANPIYSTVTLNSQ